MNGTSRIDELERKFIENPRRYFAPLANEYRKAGDPHQAIAICRAHLGQLPGHMSGQIVYGQALFEGGEYDEARTVFETALGMDRENLIALKHLGDLALRNGETGAARQFYSKLLEIDPQDSKVIAIVKEMESTSEAEQPVEASIAADATGPEPTRHGEEEAVLTEELGYPVPPSQAFVTETMAELYLAQGFRDRAVNVYRELAAYRPDDERLKSRLAELDVDEMPTEYAMPVKDEMPVQDEIPVADEKVVEDRREEPPSVESPETPPDTVRSPSIETPAPSAPEVQPPSEESISGDDSAVDSPPSEIPPSGPDSVEDSGGDEPRAEPEGIAANLTVREFFATLGRRRPTSLSTGNGSNGMSDGDASRDVFAGERSSESDSLAASALAGAFSPAPKSHTVATPGATGAGKESEEDVARFRAWLDGLTGQ